MELKEKVEQVCLKYAQETNWDFDKLDAFIAYSRDVDGDGFGLTFEEFLTLPGTYSWDKAKYLFNTHNPEVNVGDKVSQARSRWFN